jgi:large subunit ribosomal protein L7/L12
MADDNNKTEEVKEAAADAKEAAEEAKEAVEEVKEVAAQVKEEVKETKPAAKAVSANLDKIIKTIEELSVLELSELVKALEEKFGVSAAAPVAAAAGAQAAEAPGEEQTTFNVILAEGGANKISVIKAVRELVPTLGLKEAKDLVDAAPKPVLEGVNKETANEAKTKLETAGAKVELK